MKNVKFNKVMALILSLIMTLSIFGVCVSAVGAIDLYVDAVYGDDGNTGTQSSPFKTVAKAKEALGSSAGNLHFSDGEYFIDSAITYTSGSATVNYIADGEAVVFTGAQKISGWQDEYFNGMHCWSYSPENMPDQVMLYSNSGYLQNSRMPNSGNFYLESGDDPESDNPVFARNRSVITHLSDTEMLAKCDFSDGNKSFIRIMHYWTEELLVVGSFDLTTGKITFNANYGMPYTGCTAAEVDPYYFENIACGFDLAGEWYADYSAKKVYYLPKDGETKENAQIYLASAEQLVYINGADNIHFNGITFKNTNWIYSSNYSQSAYDSKSAILINNATGIEFNNCSFINIGASAVNFGNWGNGNNRATENCSVTGCLFKNIGASAIVVGGSNASSVSGYVPKNITLHDNLIYNYGLTRSQATALFITNANHITVTNNEIHDGLYTGISCGWSWGYNTTNNSYNKINNNLIYNIGYGSLSDMGGIYVLGIQENSEIKNNVIHNVCTGADCTTYGGWGIYTDEGSTGWTVENNIVYDCGSQGFHQHYGYQNVIRNNIFAFNEEGQVRSSACKVPATSAEDTSGEGKLTKDVADGTQFTLQGNILVGKNQFMYHQLNKNFFTDRNNLYWDYINGADVVSRSYNSSRLNKSTVQRDYGTNNYNGGVYANPQFVDETNRNFNFNSADIAVSLTGFTKIDATNVGSNTYGSKFLINNLKSAKYAYSSDLWDEWEEAKTNAVTNRTPESITALSKAYSSLSVMDNFSQYVIDFSRYYHGTEYNDYMTAYNKVVNESSTGSAVSQALVDELSVAYYNIVNKNYTIAFDKGEYSADIPVSSINYTYSQGEIVLPSPTIPASEHLKFLGWERSTDYKVFPANTVIKVGSGSYSFVGRWADEHTLSLNSTGGKWVNESSSTGSIQISVGTGEVLGDYFSQHKLVRDGYVLTGWTYNGETYTDDSIMPNHDLVLQPVWSEVCNVYYDNELYSALEAGWNGGYFGDMGGSNVESVVCDDIYKTFTITGTTTDCYAYITNRGIPVTPGNTYRLSYDCDGGCRMLVAFMLTENGWNEAEINGHYIETSDKKIVFTAPEGRNYIALRIGIFGGASSVTSTYSNLVLQDITNDTTRSKPSFGIQTYVAGSTVTETPAITRSGYVLKGWSTVKNASTPDFAVGSVINNSGVVYPVWESACRIYFDNLFKFDEIGDCKNGTEQEFVIDEGAESISIKVNNPDDSFIGSTSKITDLIEGGKYKISYDIKVDGKSAPELARVTVNACDWVGGAEHQKYWETVTSGQVLTLFPEKNYIEIRLGVRQNTETLGKTVTYSNITVQEVSDTTYGPSINGVTTYSKVIKQNSTYGNLPEISKNGYVFLGWYTERTGGTKISQNTVKTESGNQYLYSHWVETEKAQSAINVTDSANSCYTVVPETVYLNPANGKGLANYVNNTFNRTTFEGSNNIIENDKEKSAEGKVFFYNSEAAKVKIKIDGLSSSLLQYRYSNDSDFSYVQLSNGCYTLDLRDSKGYVECRLTNASLQDAVASGESDTIKWEFVYNTADGEKTAYAFSTVYSPLSGDGSILAMGVVGRRKGNSEYACTSNATTWLYGVHDIIETQHGQGTNDVIGTYDGTVNPLALGTTCTEKDFGRNTSSSNSWLSYKTGGKGYRGYWGSGDSNYAETVTNYYEGVLYVDSSRYNNLNQIPMLCAGVDLHEIWQGRSEMNNTYSLGIYNENAEEKLRSRTNLIAEAAGVNSTYRGVRVAVDTVPYKLSGGNETLILHGYAQARVSSATMLSYLNIVSVNKTDLRNQLRHLFRLNYRAEWFTDYDASLKTSKAFNTYLEVLRKASLVLGKPNATQDEINAACSSLKDYELSTVTYNNCFNIWDWASNDKSVKTVSQTSGDIFKYDIADNSITFTEDGATDGGSYIVTTSYSQKNLSYYNVKVNPDTTYRFSAKFKSNKASSDAANFNFVINCYDELGDKSAVKNSINNQVSLTNGNTPVSGEYEYRYIDFTTGSDCDNIQFSFGYNGANTDFTAKDISLVPLNDDTFTYSYTNAVSGSDIYLPSSISNLTGIQAVEPETGFKFDGWYDEYNEVYFGTEKRTFNGTKYDVGSSLPGNDDGSYSPLTLWSAFSAIKYSIKYHANGGTGTMQTTVVAYNPDATFVIPECAFMPANSDYVFVGWNTKANGSGMSYSAGQEIANTLSSTDNSEIPLYAQWNKKTTINVLPNYSAADTDLIGFTDGGTSFTDGTDITFNGTLQQNGNVSLEGIVSAKDGERIETTEKMFANLVEGHRYKLTFTADNPNIDFYLYKSGHTMQIGYYTGRLKNPVDNGDGTYSYSAVFTVGDRRADDTDAADRSFNTENDLTGVYYFRMSYRGENTETSYSVSELNLVETENSFVQFSGTSLNYENPVRPGYTFCGWVVNGNAEATNNGDSYTFTFAASDSTVTAAWKNNSIPDIAQDKTYVFDIGSKIEVPFTSNGNGYSGLEFVKIGSAVENGTVLGNEGYASADRLTGNTSFTVSTEGDSVYLSSSILFTNSQSFYYCCKYDGSYYYGKITLIPSSSVYFEEALFDFSNNGASGEYAWNSYSVKPTASDGELNSLLQNSQSLTDKANYSGESAKWCKVDGNSLNKPSFSFTFTGTGFDLYSVLSCYSGLFNINVVDNNTDGDKGTDYKYDCRYGYGYGILYLDENLNLTLDPDTECPLYYLPDGEPFEILAGNSVSATVMPTQYVEGNSGAVEFWLGDEGKTPAYVYGWAKVNSNNPDDALYQSPIVSMSLDKYSSYTVTVTPEYSQEHDIDSKGFSLFYVDGVRIYNPLGQKNPIEQVYTDAYSNAVELDSHYIPVSSVVEPIMFYDSIYQSVDILENLDSQVLLQPGQHITLKVAADRNTAPDKLSLGCRLASGEGTAKLIVTSDKSGEITLDSKTESYKELYNSSASDNIISWSQVDGKAQSGNITIRNTSNDNVVVSLTNIKWSYNNIVEAATDNSGINRSHSGSGSALIDHRADICDGEKAEEKQVDVQQASLPETASAKTVDLTLFDFISQIFVLLENILKPILGIIK